MIHVVIDQDIPYIQEALRRVAHVTALPSDNIHADAVHDADALIVRTRTRCDESLLAGSRVTFIATATIGYDHIDTHWCDAHHIRWTNAPGCNASSVCQYVRCALQLMEREHVVTLRGSTLGIVGVGHVGSLVKAMATQLGMQVLCCDPPREERGDAETFYPLSALAEACDILTFHVPLAREGKHATFHLADGPFFASLARKPLLINTSRGEVVCTEALKAALHDGTIRQAVIDVWEHEPHIDPTLLRMARIATPHIAGYSADGKARASQMALDALCSHFGLPAQQVATPPPSAGPYNIDSDVQRLKTSPHTFEYQRNHYPIRRE